MAKFDKEELNTKAQEYMNSVEGCAEVVITEDGNIFVKRNIGYARSHAKAQGIEAVIIKKEAKAEAKPKKEAKASKEAKAATTDK